MEKRYANRIWGASDDLLEIDGALIEDEVNTPNRPYTVRASDGTHAIFYYNDDGEWKCDVKKKGLGFIEVVTSVGHDGVHTNYAEGCSPYSDVLFIREPLSWISVNRKYFRS
ncbi:MAG TPA: hypothetical protein PKV73_01260 [Agriterribacter sp.]|nr:hypothetical protein [Agriterribacter sp.]